MKEKETEFGSVGYWLKSWKDSERATYSGITRKVLFKFGYCADTPSFQDLQSNIETREKRLRHTEKYPYCKKGCSINGKAVLKYRMSRSALVWQCPDCHEGGLLWRSIRQRDERRLETLRCKHRFVGVLSFQKRCIKCFVPIEAFNEGWFQWHRRCYL